MRHLISLILISSFLYAEDVKDYTKLFKLRSHKTEQCTVYFEDGLVFDQKEIFAAANKFFKALRDLSKLKELDEKQIDTISIDLCKIIGATSKEDIDNIRRSLGDMSLKPQYPLLGKEQAKIIFAKKKTIIKVLKSGNKLPFLTYLPTTNEISFELMAGFRKSDVIETLVWPCDTEKKDYAKRFPESISMVSEKIEGMADLGAILYLKIQLALQMRCPEIIKCRWFLSGVSLSLTFHLMKNHNLDSSKLGAFLKEETRTAENQINLRYWPPPHFTVPADVTDNDSARQKASLKEFDRIFTKSGYASLGKILEKINDKAQLDEKKVLESIKAVTGFDMGDRLDSYQTFKGREEGIKKYKDIIASNPDDKAFISAWNRLLEIQMQKFSFLYVIHYADALASRDRAKSGLRYMEKMIQRERRKGNPIAFHRANEQAVIYAFKNHLLPEADVSFRIYRMKKNNRLTVLYACHEYLAEGFNKSAFITAEDVKNEVTHIKDQLNEEMFRAIIAEVELIQKESKVKASDIPEGLKSKPGLNSKDSMPLFEKRAKAGNVHSMITIAIFSLQKDPERSFKHTKMAAEKGYSGAMNMLAMYYLNGIGTEKNISEAKKWANKAVKKMPEANVVLALIELNKNDQKINDQVKIFLQKAIDNHVIHAFRLWASLEKDREQLIRLLRAAASYGDANALFHLARLSTKPEEQKRYLYFAAQFGHPQARKIISDSMAR